MFMGLVLVTEHMIKCICHIKKEKMIQIAQDLENII
jgi:hypothetical protein